MMTFPIDGTTNVPKHQAVIPLLIPILIPSLTIINHHVPNRWVSANCCLHPSMGLKLRLFDSPNKENTPCKIRQRPFDTCFNNGSPWRSGWKKIETCSFQCSIGNHILLAWGCSSLNLDWKDPEMILQNSSGWFSTYPSEKYESPLGVSFTIYGRTMKHVPNRQPVFLIVFYPH